MQENKTLLARLIEAGYPKDEIYHHYSDLYVFVTPLTKRIIEEWCKENGYAGYRSYLTFRDNITGRLMYDCAFQYYEEERG